MEKEFVPYEQALALKKLGFDELCLASFETETNWHVEHRPWRNSEDPTEIASPLYPQGFRWFREKYELSHTIKLTDNSRHYYYDFTIFDSKNRDYNDEDCFDSCKRIYDNRKFSKYEEAELECLKKLIEIVKEKK